MPSVLIVDDDPAKVVALEAILAPLEVRMVSAGSGHDALRRLLEDDFSLVLLDVKMPQLDGFETAAFIRQRPRSAKTPIIFVTAFGQAEADFRRGYEAGAIDFVTSPIDPVVLRRKVEAIIGLESDRLSLLQELASARKDKERTADYLKLATHEMRAPLSVIAGYVSMLRDGSLPQGSPAFAKVMDVLISKVEAIDHLASGLLLAARAEFPTAAAQTVDLNACALTACQRAAPRAALLGTKINLEAAEASIEVRGDASDVGRVLDNLIGNALSYSPAGDEVTVRLVDTPGAMPRVEVSDKGDGVPASAREQIFEPFFRVTPNRDANGSGLGLYLSRRLAERYDGRLDLIDSEPDQGSTFALSLPRAEDQH